MFNIKKIFKNHSNKKYNITFLGCDTNLSYGVVGMENGKICSFEERYEFLCSKN